MTAPADHRPSDWDETRATASLPGLDVDIRHRRAWQGDAEQLQITLSASPSFEAAGRMLEAGNPMLLWLRMVEAAWAPWLAMLGSPAGRLPGPGRD